MDHSNCVSKQEHEKEVVELKAEIARLNAVIVRLEQQMEEQRIQRYFEDLMFELQESQSHSSCGSFVQAYSSWQS